MLRRLSRLFRSRSLPSLELPPERWDAEYRARKWDYLEGLSELARYSVIAGYIRFLDRCESVLEVGCGTGLLHERLAGARPLTYTGVDLSAAAIERASRLAGPSTRFVAADGRSFSDGRRYDVIVFNEALYYFDDCIAVLDHYERSLNDGGFFIVSMVVGDVSEAHWRRIDGRCRTIDAVQLRNGRGITWNCRLLAPAAPPTSARSSGA